jgi:exodeoxyribonuclease-3
MANRKIITYNVNGIRSALSKGWMEWLRTVNPDIVLLQEIKAEPGQLDLPVFENDGYLNYWHPAQKKGYSGVAIFSKQEPDHVEIGSGDADIDAEGRIIRADFGKTSVMSVYVPSGSSGEERQDYKMEWLAWFNDYIKKLKKKRPQLIIGGDINICHRPIDIHNPVSNAKELRIFTGRKRMDGSLSLKVDLLTPSDTLTMSHINTPGGVSDSMHELKI